MDPEVAYFNDVFISVQINDYFYQYDAATDANAWMDAHYDELNAGTPAAFDVLFSSLVAKNGGPAINMTLMSQVEAIHVHVCSENRNMDYGIDQIAAIPEPAAVTFIVWAGIAMLVGRRFIHR